MPMKNDIPYEEINNGALILLLLREQNLGRVVREDTMEPIPLGSKTQPPWPFAISYLKCAIVG